MNKTQPDGFALETLRFLEEWWATYGKEFDRTDAPSLLQRSYADEKRVKEKACEIGNIPVLEITSLYREANGGMLFVNCNPSGTDYEFYGKHNNPPRDLFYYDNQDNAYFKAVEKFAERVKAGSFSHCAMIDVFPIVIQNQALLKNAYIEANAKAEGIRWEAFKALIDRFIDNIERIKPKVVIVTNAFVKDLIRFVPDDGKRKTDVRIKSLQAARLEDYVAYRIDAHGFSTTVFCGGMIAGGHQMDTESKERLIREVRKYLERSE